VELPELDAVLDEHRRALDPSRPWGMPAHLTLLYPFVAPADVNGETLARLSRAATGVMSFKAAFADFGWFDDHVLWLAPSDPARLVQDSSDDLSSSAGTWSRLGEEIRAALERQGLAVGWDGTLATRPGVLNLNWRKALPS
jgi:2'-5' RNA ligase